MDYQKLFHVFWVVLFVVSSVFAAEADPADDNYKSLFIYNFTKMIEWPDEMQNGDFVIQVVGNSAIADKLAKLNKSVGEQKIVVTQPEELSEIKSSHILFVDGNNNIPLDSLINKIENRFCLVISEDPNTLSHGVMINFIHINGVLTYEYSSSAFESADIVTSLDFKSLGEARE